MFSYLSFNILLIPNIRRVDGVQLGEMELEALNKFLNAISIVCVGTDNGNSPQRYAI